MGVPALCAARVSGRGSRAAARALPAGARLMRARTGLVGYMYHDNTCARCQAQPPHEHFGSTLERYADIPHPPDPREHTPQARPTQRRTTSPTHANTYHMPDPRKHTPRARPTQTHTTSPTHANTPRARPTQTDTTSPTHANTHHNTEARSGHHSSNAKIPNTKYTCNTDRGVRSDPGPADPPPPPTTRPWRCRAGAPRPAPAANRTS